MLLPRARGSLGEALHHLLRRPVDPDPVDLPEPDDAADAALALWVLHEIHYRGFDDVDAAWEWAPATIGPRWRLEHDLEHRLRTRFEEQVESDQSGDLAANLRELIRRHDGPSLARQVRSRATVEQVLELLRQRSIYHLKEADPTSWAIARLDAGPKAALVQLQYDEYGAGDPKRLHHELFARGLEAVGLDAHYGAYIDEALTSALDHNNAMSLFGLHRRWRGAAVGHLAAFEATSSLPSAWMAHGLRRLGFAEEMCAYYDEHVEADAVHDQLAIHEICGPLVDEEPSLRQDVLFGAWSCLDLEAAFATELAAHWESAEARSA